MYPFGVDCKKAPTAKVMHKVATIGAEALKKVHGTSFAVGGENSMLTLGICETIYQASGSSVDWGYAKVFFKLLQANVSFPFAIELRDTGKYGFLLPAEQIIPSGEEMTEAIFAMSNAIVKEEYNAFSKAFKWLW